MAGMGGQGVLLAGQVLAQAAMDAGLEVSWFPLYSPEVRGGSATCTVVVADDEVGSPVAGQPAMILMDRTAVDDHLDRAKPGVLVVVNSSLAGEEFSRDDVRIVAVPANDIAAELGSQRSVNMVLLGGYVGTSELVTLEMIQAALREVIPERHHSTIPVNLTALQSGAEWAINQLYRGDSSS